MVVHKKWWRSLVQFSLIKSVWIAWAVLLKTLCGRSEKKLHNTIAYFCQNTWEVHLETTKLWLWHSPHSDNNIKIICALWTLWVAEIYFLYKVNTWKLQVTLSHICWEVRNLRHLNNSRFLRGLYFKIWTHFFMWMEWTFGLQQINMCHKWLWCTFCHDLCGCCHQLSFWCSDFLILYLYCQNMIICSMYVQ